MARIAKIRATIYQLRELQDAQMETALLRSCLSLPKLAFILRCCPPPKILNALNYFDDVMREALSDMLGSPLSDWAWLKASLPSSSGGLGLRQATLHAPAAYIGSLYQARHLISDIISHPAVHSPFKDFSLSLLRVAAAKPEWFHLTDIDVRITQHSLSRVIDEASLNSLLASAPDIRSRALTLSTSIHHAGDWLNVIPSSALGLHIHDREFRMCLQYWLGLPMFADESPCPVCHLPADRFGDHQVGCGGNSDRIYRHNAVRDVLFSAAQSAALSPRQEAPCLIPGSQSRPADVFLPTWSRGRPAALDITVISPLQQATLQGAATTQGHALTTAEIRKFASHGPHCEAAGIDFIPVSFEALGGMSPLTITTVARIGRLLGQRHGLIPKDTTRHLFQQVSVSLWRGNASLWCHRFPHLPPRLDGVT